MHPEHLIQLRHKADALPHPPQKQSKGLRFIFPSSPLAVRKALADALSALRYLDLSGEETGTIELVLAEAMNNIVEHAYADNLDGMIELHITPTERGLCCTLLDDGHPMPDGAVPLGTQSSLDCDMPDLPEGGFGWFLIRDLAHDLEYSQSNGKNQLKLRISVGQPRMQAN